MGIRHLRYLKAHREADKNSSRGRLNNITMLINYRREKNSTTS